MSCGTDSRKIAQLKANPAAQLVCNDEKFALVATIGGKGEVVDSKEAKQKLWEAMPVLANYLSGPDDPNFGVIKFVADKVELLNMAEGMGMHVAEL